MEISWALPVHVAASTIYPSLIPRFLSKEQSMGNRNETLPHTVTLFLSIHSHHTWEKEQRGYALSSSGLY